MLSKENVQGILEILASPKIKNLDLTGGAPELHPQFREIVSSATELKKNVIVRHNLTVTYDLHPLTNEKMLWVPEFFASKKVDVVCSLPYYREFLTDRQRGHGVFKKSILGLQELNRLGYGIAGSGLILNLVYNPIGSYLPPSQKELEVEYKAELKNKYNIEFNNLFTITNMPVKRFKDDLVRTGNYEQYMKMLSDAFNPAAAKSVMCRNMLSVSWDGKIYDCDFNQMLDLPTNVNDNRPFIHNLNLDELLSRKIVFANHCLGCSAGSGSSCGGSTAS